MTQKFAEMLYLTIAIPPRVFFLYPSNVTLLSLMESLSKIQQWRPPYSLNRQCAMVLIIIYRLS